MSSPFAGSRESIPGGRARGFTLLEVLVAMVLLALLLGQAEEESWLGGMPLAWVAREDGYEFQRRELSIDGPGWVTVRGDDLFHPRALPGLARIQWVRADGRELDFGERAVLGGQGLQQLAVSLTLGAARMRVERRPDGSYGFVEVTG